jgi:hypothetical protein
VYSDHLESPGTKAFSEAQARKMFSIFDNVEITTTLTHGDLLESNAGQLHQGFILNLARKLWPRKLLKRFFPRLGLFMMIKAKK